MKAKTRPETVLHCVAGEVFKRSRSWCPSIFLWCLSLKWKSDNHTMRVQPPPFKTPSSYFGIKRTFGETQALMVAGSVFILCWVW